MNGETFNDKIWINAITPSTGLLYLTNIILFVVAPVGILYLLYKALIFTDFQITTGIIILFFAACLLFLLLAFVYRIFRKYVPIKIKTNMSGINYFGLFGNIHLHWNEIKSIKPIKILFRTGYIIEIRANNGNIYFPITMKEKDNMYPKFAIGFREKWIDNNGVEKPVIPENCPLYLEIQKHLNNLKIEAMEG